MLRLIIALTTLALTCSATLAQNVAQDFLDEIEAAHADIVVVYYDDTAPLTMEAELLRRGASYALEQGYAASWGSHVYFGASNISTFYHVARRQMLSWVWAVDRGDLDNATAARLLAEPMAVFRLSHAELQDGLAAQVSFLGLRGRHVTDAHDAFLANDRAAREAYQRRAERARLASERAVPWYLRNLNIIPDPSQPDLTLEDLIADLPEPVRLAAGQLADAAGFVGDVAGALVEDSLPARMLTGTIEWLFDQRDFDIADRLATQNGMDWAQPGTAELARFEQDLLMTLGDLAPLWARDAANRGEVSQAELSQLTGPAARLAQLLDDIGDATGDPSRLQRALAGLHAAVQILEASNPQLDMSDVNTIFNSLGTVFPGIFSPTGPFAMQSGMIVGELQTVRGAWNDATESLGAVERASRGEAGALERAQGAAERLQSRFQGPEMAREILGGAAAGASSNIPILRYFSGVLG